MLEQRQQVDAEQTHGGDPDEGTAGARVPA
jgi:hypothetical protein